MKASYDTSTLVLYKYFAVELEGRMIKNILLIFLKVHFFDFTAFHYSLLDK